jgi:hypothetical protein
MGERAEFAVVVGQRASGEEALESGRADACLAQLRRCP